MVTSASGPTITTPKTVVTCYDLLDLVVRAGVRDLTEGMYYGDVATPYEQAQQNQADHLLDEAGCHDGSHVLDIGCGYGRILETAQRRGASAIGVTISSHQLEYCCNRGLDVRLLNYREISDQVTERFDCVIANGSLEHFVDPRDAVEGRSDEIYGEMFEICHCALDPYSDSGRFVTTAIHFSHVEVDPRDALRPPSDFRRGSNEHHFALLANGFGGFYPAIGQLERCATGYFALLAEEDGTHDYHLTAEQWLRILKTSLRTNARFITGVVSKLLRHPKQAFTMLDCLLAAQSWNWQFRGPNPPMRLLRQTWQRIG